MKLRPLVAEPGGGAAYPASSASLAFAGAPAGAAAQGIAEVGASTARAAESMSEVETRLQRERQTTDVLRIETSAVDALNQLENDLNHGTRDAEANLVTPPASGKDYLARWREGVAGIRKQIAADTQDPILRAGAERALGRTFVEREARARASAARRMLDEDKAAINTMEDELARRAALSPDLEDRRRASDLYRAYLGTKGLVLGEEEVQKRLTGFNERVAEIEADRALQSDTFTAEAFRDRLSPEKLGRFIDRAIKLDEKRTRQAAQALEVGKRRAMSDYTAAVVNGQLPPAQRAAQLETMRVTWDLTDQEYLRMKKLDEEKETKLTSDPATLRLVRADVHSMQPKLTEAQINAFYDAGKLTVDDWTKALDRRRETLEANRREGDSIVAREHAQAEEELRLATGAVPGMISRLDPIQEKVLEEVIVQLRRRSAAYGGKESPLAVKEELRERIRGILGDDAALRVNEIHRLLKFDRMADLEKAKAAGQITEGEYKNQRALFTQRDELLKRMELSAAHDALKKQIKAVAPTPYTGPKAK